MLCVDKGELLVGIAHLAHVSDEAPVECGRSGIARRPWVHDKRHPGVVHLWRDVLCEEGADDEVWLCEFGSLDHALRRKRIFDGHDMTPFAQHQCRALANDRIERTNISTRLVYKRRL